MRLPIFIPIILINIFCVMMLISSFVVGPSWKFYLSLIGVIVFTVSSIITGGQLIRQGESDNQH